MIKQDILEDRHNTIILALGSNLGNRADNIEKTKFHLSHFCYFLKVSKLYETPSWPNQSNPKFLNLIIECKTDLTIIDLFEKIKKIETLLGRKKSIKNAPRTCDIDIIDFNNTCKNIIHKGQKIKDKSNQREFCIVLLSGTANFATSKNDFGIMKGRSNVFEKIPPIAMYVPKDEAWEILAKENCEIAVCTAPSVKGNYISRMITHENMSQEVRGEGSNKRFICNILPFSPTF